MVVVVNNADTSSRGRVRFGASTALVTFTLLLWPALLLSQYLPNSDGKPWFEAVTAFCAVGPGVFAPLAAIVSIAYFARRRRLQYLVELALMVALFIVFALNAPR